MVQCNAGPGGGIKIRNEQNFLCACHVRTYMQGKFVTPPYDMLLWLQALHTVQNGFLGRGLEKSRILASLPT